MASVIKTAYQILEVSEQAQHKDIKDAYKKLALRSHPDKNPNDPQAKITFQLISEAYETIGDAHRRLTYDTKLRSQRGVPTFFAEPRTKQDTYDGGSEIPSRAPPKRPNYAYDWFYGFQRYWQNAGDQSTTSEPQPSWYGNIPPNADSNGSYTQDEWQGFAPSPPDLDRALAEEQEMLAEKLRKVREEHEARKAAAQDERHKRQWPLRQTELLSVILILDNTVAGLESELIRAKHAGEGHSPDIDSGTGEVCDKEIRLNSRRRKLQDSLGKHANICKLQRRKGWLEQAEQAEANLIEARTQGYQVKVSTQIRRKDAESDFVEPKRNRKPVDKEESRSEERQENEGIGPVQQSEPGAKEADTKRETGSQAHLREWLANLGHPFLNLCFDPNTSRPSPPPPDSPITTGRTDQGPLVAGLKRSGPTAVIFSTCEVDPIDDPHLSHLEVHRGFWEFAPGMQKCTVCLEEGIALQCPMCAETFCSVCKDSYVGGSVPVEVLNRFGRW